MAIERKAGRQVNREQLAHVLRSAARIADDNEIIVIGSQAILASYEDDELPEEATRSVEVDVAFRFDPHDEKSDRVDGAIGEGSGFHSMNGYYGQGVSVSTAVLPTGWQDRLIAYERLDAAPSNARCLEPHDLVISKLVAGREKDRSFATELLREHLVDEATLRARAKALEVIPAVQDAVLARITRCARAASDDA
jgi:hypothetical protein